jgi:hypothetical protein
MSEPTAFTVVTRYRVGDIEHWLPSAREALAPLAAQELCLGADIGASIDDPQLGLIITRWASVGDYRRAMSAFEVKMYTVPMLSQSIDEPTTFEVLHHTGPDGVINLPSARAHDADSIDLGAAAADHVRARLSTE